MSLFGGSRDVSLFRHVNRELLNNIIETKCGYYKIDLDKTVSNIYGESGKKIYKDPVLINCLIDRGEQSFSSDDFGSDLTRDVKFRFLRDDLAGNDVTLNGFNYNIVPEVGDILLWNNNYFEVDGFIENQYFVGKDPSYSYSEDTEDFGTSLSIIVNTHMIRPEKVGITKSR